MSENNTGKMNEKTADIYTVGHKVTMSISSGVIGYSDNRPFMEIGGNYSDKIVPLEKICGSEGYLKIFYLDINDKKKFTDMLILHVYNDHKRTLDYWNGIVKRYNVEIPTEE